MSDEIGNLEREIRAWAARPPARPPAAARTRVLARLDERRPRPWWRLAAAAAVLALALASSLLLVGPEGPDGSSPGGPTLAAAEPAAGILVYELRSGTKLYFALTSSRPPAEPPAGTVYPE